MKIEKIWLSDDAVWVRRDDWAEASESFFDYPRLKFASSKQRACFIVDDFGIRWPELDEDLLFEGFFRVLNLCRFAKILRFAQDDKYIRRKAVWLFGEYSLYLIVGKEPFV